MTSIIMDKPKNPLNSDAEKDCPDFIPLNDGTIVGDRKYCDKSRLCRQINMYSEWHEWEEYYLDETGEMCKEIVRDYLCTGIYARLEDRGVDEEAS